MHGSTTSVSQLHRHKVSMMTNPVWRSTAFLPASRPATSTGPTDKPNTQRQDRKTYIHERSHKLERHPSLRLATHLFSSHTVTELLTCSQGFTPMLSFTHTVLRTDSHGLTQLLSAQYPFSSSSSSYR